MEIVCVRRKAPETPDLSPCPYGYYMKRVYHGEVVSETQDRRMRLPIKERNPSRIARSGRFIPEIYGPSGFWIVSNRIASYLQEVPGVEFMEFEYAMLYDLPFPRYVEDVPWDIEKESVEDFFGRISHCPDFDKDSARRKHQELVLPHLLDSVPIASQLWLSNRHRFFRRHVSRCILEAAPMLYCKIGVIMTPEVYDRLKIDLPGIAWTVETFPLAD